MAIFPLLFSFAYYIKIISLQCKHFLRMKMIIGFVKERPAWEYRVALVPQTVKQLMSDGHQVLMETGAGERAGYSDEQYREAGAILLRQAEEVYKKSELMPKIWAPHEEEYVFLHENLWILAHFDSYKYPERLAIWKKYKINALAFERLPRLPRVQDIDVLSSQHNLAGYKAALLTMDMLDQSIPLMMTAAGTLMPLKALVIGAGVAGLQAIATLQRMGAQVYAADVRPEAAEQVKSLGAKFMPSETEYINQVLPECSIVIACVATISGVVPQILSQFQLNRLPRGAVVLDMADGNVEGAINDRLLDNGRYKLLADSHLAADIAYSSSMLYSQNVYNVISGFNKLKKDTEVWSQILLTSAED